MKRRIPDAAELIYCVECRKPTNGRGWHGPGCICGTAGGNALRGAPSVGTMR